MFRVLGCKSKRITVTHKKTLVIFIPESSIDICWFHTMNILAEKLFLVQCMNYIYLLMQTIAEHNFECMV